MNKSSNIELALPGCSSFLDNSFGPVIEPCARAFDFTLYFEETVLSIVPSSAFLVLAFIRISLLRTRKPLVVVSLLRIVKVVSDR